MLFRSEDAPCHRKTGEERTQLVALDCTVYFLPKVQHNAIIDLCVDMLIFHFMNPSLPNGDAS